ncbi:T9SS type A sorting domain-containing protein, partial [bacterium]|nr:T9SS type A sorting domain-containing protein [bacterium]
TNPTAVTAASFAPTPEGENSFVEPIPGVQITYEEVTSAGFTTAVAESSQSRVSPEGNFLPDCAVLPGSRAHRFLYISISTEAVYRSLIQVDVLMEGSRLFYASGISDTFRDFTVVGSIEDARGTMPRFSEITQGGGSRLETGPTEVVLVDDTRELPAVTLYKFWRLEKAMATDAVPSQGSCPWEVLYFLQSFRERARDHYDAGATGNALSELAIMNSILRDHAGWCVPESSDDEEMGNLVGKILAHSKTLMYSIELESGETFTSVEALSSISLAVVNPSRGDCKLVLSGPVGAEVAVHIYSVSGRLVATVFEGRLPAGGETIVWNGRDQAGHPIASGVYFARVESGGEMQTAKLVYIR